MCCYVPVWPHGARLSGHSPRSLRLFKLGIIFHGSLKCNLLAGVNITEFVTRNYFREPDCLRCARKNDYILIVVTWRALDCVTGEWGEARSGTEAHDEDQVKHQGRWEQMLGRYSNGADTLSRQLFYPKSENCDTYHWTRSK